LLAIRWFPLTLNPAMVTNDYTQRGPSINTSAGNVTGVSLSWNAGQAQSLDLTVRKVTAHLRGRAVDHTGAPLQNINLGASDNECHAVGRQILPQMGILAQPGQTQVDDFGPGPGIGQDHG